MWTFHAADDGHCADQSVLVSFCSVTHAAEDGMLHQDVARCRKGKDRKGAHEAGTKVGCTELKTRLWQPQVNSIVAGSRKPPRLFG